MDRKGVTYKNLHKVCREHYYCEECPGSRICPRYRKKFGTSPFIMYELINDINSLTIEGQELLAKIYKQ